jgi:hypothetical protein
MLSLEECDAAVSEYAHDCEVDDGYGGQEVVW